MTALESPSHLSFLGQFLLRRGIVSEEQLLAAVYYQKDVNELIGDIAVRRQYLTPDDVEAILQAQRDSELPFGQIAVDQGRLSPQQRESLVQAQAMGYVFLGEALLAKGFITADTFIEAINEFTRMERALASCNRDVLFCSEHRHLFLDMVDSMRVAMQRTAGVVMKLGRLSRPGDVDALFNDGLRADAGFRLDLRLLAGLVLHFWVFFPDDLARKILHAPAPRPGRLGMWSQNGADEDLDSRGVCNRKSGAAALIDAVPADAVASGAEQQGSWSELAGVFVAGVRERLTSRDYNAFSATARWVRAIQEKDAMDGALLVNLECPEGVFNAGFIVEDAGRDAQSGMDEHDFEPSS